MVVFLNSDAILPLNTRSVSKHLKAWVALIFTLYAITMFSIYGGKLLSIIIVRKTGRTPRSPNESFMSFLLLYLVLLRAAFRTISPGCR